MMHAARWAGWILASAFAGGIARAQSTTRVSLDSSGQQGSDDSIYPVLSANGRFVAFQSISPNLVPGDTNWQQDIFVRDRLNGTTQRVNISSTGVQADLDSYAPAISADGNVVGFYSDAIVLVAGDTNGCGDIFVHDRASGLTERVNVSSAGVQSNAYSYYCSLSADGRFAAFLSFGSNLVAGDTNGTSDLFVRDRQLGSTTRVNVATGGAQANGPSGYGVALSDDGRYVVFASAAPNLVAGDTNGQWDIFVHDMLLGTTVRASVDSLGGQSNSASQNPAISADGRFVSFESFATNLVAGDTNGQWDIFVHDMQSGATERVNVGPGGVEGDLDCYNGELSGDGRYASFCSNSTNLVPSDTNGNWDGFVRDLLSGTTERVSLSSAGLEVPLGCNFASISANGRFVGFASQDAGVVAGDTNNMADVFVRDRGAQPPIGFCFGDGSVIPCPCANNGAAGRGCENSSSSGGALLSATGSSLLANDTLVFTSSGELPHALSIFLQGNATIAPAAFADGLRCTAGALKRLYVHNASAGVVTAPLAGEPTVSARSAALGDTLGAGGLRYYQTYYRDPAPSFCPDPPGGNWNISSGLVVTWDL